MKRLVVFLAVLLAILFLAPAANVSAGSGADCSVSPHNGPPGTVFTFWCSGFSPNTYVNVWTVDPSGVAQNGPAVPGAPGSVKTDASGNASFVWDSPGGQGSLYLGFLVSFSVEFGDWTWYVNELCYGKPCVVGSAAVHIDGVAVNITGAELHVSPELGYAGETEFTVTGSGFTPLQMVTLWESVPPMCDASSSLFSTSAGYDGDVKADAAGNIFATLSYSPGNCLGEYSLTAREVKSERGAITTFRLTGKPISPTYGDSDTLTVSPNTINAAAAIFQVAATVSGSGFQPGEIVSCWVTRPDTAVALGFFNYGFDTKADASGRISEPLFGSDLSSHMGTGDPVAWSAQSGMHRITCRGNASGVMQLGSFLVAGTTFDP